MANHHRSVGCPAAAMVAPMGGLMVALGSGIASAHMAGIQAMRDAREASASATLSRQLELAMHAVWTWSDCAAEMAAEIERLKGENAHLHRVAKQNYDAAQRLQRAA